MSNRVPFGFAEAWMSFNITTDAEPMYISLGLEITDGTVIASQANTDAILTPLQERLKGLVTTEYTLGPGHVNWGDTVGEIRVDGSIAAEAGTRTAPTLPQNCAALVRKGTGSGGRRNQGRFYVPGVAEADVASNGALTTSYKTAAQTLLDSLLTDMLTLTQVDAVVLLHNEAPWTPTTINTLTIQNVLATQRRRMRR